MFLSPPTCGESQAKHQFITNKQKTHTKMDIDDVENDNIASCLLRRRSRFIRLPFSAAMSASRPVINSPTNSRDQGLRSFCIPEKVAADHQDWWSKRSTQPTWAGCGGRPAHTCAPDLGNTRLMSQTKRTFCKLMQKLYNVVISPIS